MHLRVKPLTWETEKQVFKKKKNDISKKKKDSL